MTGYLCVYFLPAATSIYPHHINETSNCIDAYGDPLAADGGHLDTGSGCFGKWVMTKKEVRQYYAGKPAAESH